MGFIDDKNSAFQQIALFETLGNLPNNRVTSSFDSVTSKSKNLLPFMLDLLTVACKDDTKPRRTSVPSFAGTPAFLPSTPPEPSPRLVNKCDLIRIVLEILVEFFPALIRIIKEGIIKALKSSLVCPADFTIPSPPPTVSLTMDEADFSKLMKVDSTSLPGSLLFGDPENDLNVFLSNLIQAGGTDTWKNLLDFSYNQNTEVLDVSINSSYVGSSFDTFLFDYINSIELLNFDNLLPNLMNQLYGSIDASLPNFDIETSIDKEKSDAIIDKILETDPCEESFIFDNSFFEFSSDELLTIESNANNRKMGSVLVDYSCTPFISSVDTNILVQLSKDLEVLPNTQVKQITEQYIDLISLSAIGEPAAPSDIEAQKKSFSVKMTSSLPKMFTDVVFTPKIVILYQVAQKMITNTITPSGGKLDFAVANKVFFEFVVRESMAALLEIIFNQIKEEIMKLVAELTIKLVKEAADKRIKQLLSLVGGTSITAGIGLIPTPDVSDFV